LNGVHMSRQMEKFLKLQILWAFFENACSLQVATIMPGCTSD